MADNPAAVPELIPVIDLMGGVVVRGVGGRRSEYRPIQSCLTNFSDPIAVGKAFVEHFHSARLYLADLDAIGGAAPAWIVYRDLRRLGVELWVDAGVRSPDEAAALAEAGIEGVVCGLETVPNLNTLRTVCNRVGVEHVIFSLDLRGGSLLRSDGWGSTDPFRLAADVIELGVERVIVLDLARVGEGAGTGTEELCSRIASTYPHVRVIAGGGIRGPEDLARLAANGVAGVLVASALHDGRILPC